MRVSDTIRSKTVLSVLATLVISTSLRAQPASNGATAGAAERVRAATTTFLDSGQPLEKRLAAAKELGPIDEEVIGSLLEVGADSKQDDKIRWEALRRTPFSERYVDVVAQIVQDPNNGGEVLEQQLLKDLSRKSIRPPAELRQKIQSVFRAALDDPRAGVRTMAYYVSVANHDSVAVNKLVDALRGGQNVPVPLPDAVEMLDIDGSVNHIGSLRPFLNHDDPAVRAKAARALAVDPESRKAIVQMALDRKAPELVRREALRGLSAADAAVTQYGLQLLENADESPAIRQAAMQAVARRVNYQETEPEAQVRFAEAVEKLAADDKLRGEGVGTIRREAADLLTHLRQTCPAVEKHYDR